MPKDGIKRGQIIFKRSCIIILWGKNIGTNMGRNRLNKKKGNIQMNLENLMLLRLLILSLNIAAGLSAKKNEKKRKLFFWEYSI